MNEAVTAVFLMGAGCLLMIGMWTRVTGSIFAVTEIWQMLTMAGDKWLWLLLGTMGAAIAMLGPGLWSLDARLYGWKRVEAQRPQEVDSSVLEILPQST